MIKFNTPASQFRLYIIDGVLAFPSKIKNKIVKSSMFQTRF